jgi:hypothetical protein
MKKYALACAAALALLGALETRASAWGTFEISFGFNWCHYSACAPCCADNCCCGWPGCPADGGAPAGYPDAAPPVGYGAPAYGYGYPAPAAPSAPASQPAPSFPPAPKPIDGTGQNSYPGYPNYASQQPGYSSTGYPSSGSYAPGAGYGSAQVPSYWYGR